MSRSFAGSKGPGFDYWSRRPGNRSGGNPPGKISKQFTHRRERRESCRLAFKAMREGE